MENSLEFPLFPLGLSVTASGRAQLVVSGCLSLDELSWGTGSKDLEPAGGWGQ